MSWQLIFIKKNHQGKSQSVCDTGNIYATFQKIRAQHKKTRATGLAEAG